MTPSLALEPLERVWGKERNKGGLVCLTFSFIYSVGYAEAADPGMYLNRVALFPLEMQKVRG